MKGVSGLDGFFAMISRMKYIERWGLMRCTRSETLADQRMKRLYGVPLLDSETRGQFIAARCAMERFQTDYALRLSCPAEGCTARLDLDAAWSCA